VVRLIGVLRTELPAERLRAFLTFVSGDGHEDDSGPHVPDVVVLRVVPHPLGHHFAGAQRGELRSSQGSEQALPCRPLA